MISKGRRFERRSLRDELRRRPPTSEAYGRILIVCEGKVTEKEYFEGWRKLHRLSAFALHVVPAGVPMTVVETAIRLRDEALQEARHRKDRSFGFDYVWCVFDRDEHPNFDQALQLAQQNGLGVALSNPCFELWLLLHYRDQRAHITRDQVQRHYDEASGGKGKSVDFEFLSARHADAKGRAVALYQWQIEQGRRRGNPWTEVHELADLLIELGRRAATRFQRGA